MKRKKGKLFAVIAALVIAAAYYYVTIPAINIHSSGFWGFILMVMILILLIYGTRRIRSVSEIK